MILISLLGDDLSNLIPVIYEFKDKITHHIIIHDDAPDDVRRMKQLQTALKRFVDKNDLKWESEAFNLDEDSKNDIVRIYHTLRSRHDAEIVLHSTEGFASLALILSNLILADGGMVITYDARDNELNMVKDTTLIRTKLTSKLGVDEYLDLLNYRIIDMQKVQMLKPRKEHVLSLFRDYNRFLNIRQALVVKDKEFAYDLYNDLLETLHALEIVDDTHRLFPEAQMMLQGSLFEEYVFWLCEELGFDDIALGVKVDFDQDDKQHDNHRVKNEFDILMTCNNRIYTVECKMVKNLEGLELIYKYDGIIDMLGSGTRAVLLNVAKKEMENYNYTKISENFRPSAIRRARMSDIEVYHDTHVNPVAFTNLIRNFFNLQK